MKKLRTKDKIFILVNLIVMIFSGHKLATIENEFRTRSQKLGHLSINKGSVSGMAVGNLKWLSVSEGQSVGAGDKILTDDDSSSEIFFDGGVVLEMGPKTLVVLQENKIILKSGNIKVRFKQVNNSNLMHKVVINNNSVEIKNDEILDVKVSDENIIFDGDGANVFSLNNLEHFKTLVECHAPDVQGLEINQDRREISITNSSKFNKYIVYDSNYEKVVEDKMSEIIALNEDNFNRVKYISFVLENEICRDESKKKLVSLDLESDVKKISEAVKYSGEDLNIYVEWDSSDLKFSLNDLKVKGGQVDVDLVDKKGRVLAKYKKINFSDWIVYRGDTLPDSILLKTEDSVSVRKDFHVPQVETPRLEKINRKISLQQVDSNRFKGEVGLSPALEWKVSIGAKFYMVNIFRNYENKLLKVARYQVNNDYLIWPKRYQQGHYFYTIVAVDKFNRESKPSDIGILEMK